MRWWLAAVAVLALAGCGSAPGTTDPAGVDGLTIPTPSPDPRDFVEAIDNPYLPLMPGSSWTYESTSSKGDETIVVTATDETRVVAGVTTTVVHDRVTGADGDLVQDTYDWYAQDTAGNVWHLGADVTSYGGGESSTEGSWEAGVDGARAGVAMLGTPRLGDGYQQGYLEGEVEDRAEVQAIDAEVVVGSESFDEVVEIAETSPLDPDLVVDAYYAPSVGLVVEETTSGGDNRVLLVAHDAG